MVEKGKIYAAVFFTAFASLAFEVSLTRIFSISLWYHFAFMVISIAMLGLAASGTAISMFPVLKNVSRLGKYCLYLGLSLSAGYLMINQIPFEPVKLQWSGWHILYIGAYYIILTFPFFFAGLIIASALATLSRIAARIYGADLLGAGLGSVVILFLIPLKGPEYPIFLLSIVMWILAFLLGTSIIRVTAVVMIGLLLLGLLLSPGLMQMHISPFKALPLALRYPGAEHLNTYHSAFCRIDTFESPAVRFAPGLSLKYMDPLPQQTGFSIDGNTIHAMTASTDKKSLKFLSYLPAALIYELAPAKKEVLVLEPGGGLAVLLARFYQAQNVYKVESNRLLVKIIDTVYRELTGTLYQEHSRTGWGRAWLQSQSRTFDIIELSLMSGIPDSASALTEDYQLTKEAFTEYIRHLEPAGMLGINLYLTPPPRSEFRILTTLLAAAKETGIANPSGHLAAIRSWGNFSLIFKRSPLTADEIEGLKTFCRQRLFDPIYYPGMNPGEANVFIQTPGVSYYRAFMQLIDDASQVSFIGNYLFDIRPVTDNRPFFNYFMKFQNIRKTYRMIGKKWEYFLREGYLLPVMLIQILIFSLILIFLPLVSKLRRRRAESGPKKTGRSALLLYFAFLGLGFMFLEIGMIQRSILVLENGAHGVAVVVASLLISSGGGSLLSSRLKILGTPRLTLAIALMIAIYSLAIPRIFPALLPLPLGLKFGLVFLSIVPLGLLMGIPFPAGICFLGRTDSGLIPWAWGVNGFSSVIAPLLAMLLALSFGYTLIFWLAGLSYLLAFLAFLLFSHFPHHGNKAHRSILLHTNLLSFFSNKG